MIINESKILIKALLYKEKFYPIWDLRFENTEYSGPQYKIKDNYETFSEHNLVNVYYDINTKKFSSGEIIEFKNKADKIPNIGDLIFYEKSHSVIKRAKLLDITWVVEHNHIHMGEHTEKEYHWYTNGMKLDYNKLYHIKVYEPRYVIEGEKNQIWPYALKTVEL